MALSSNMISAILTQNFISSNSMEALSLHAKKNMGERVDHSINYNSVEALFLLKSKKMQLVNNGKVLTIEQSISKIRKQDKKVEQKCIVYSDLHKKGYIVKEGLKFGGDFRVYKENEKHARWIVYVTSDKEKVDWRDFTAKSRVAHSSNKKILLALVDSEGDINYYEISWIKP